MIGKIVLATVAAIVVLGTSASAATVTIRPSGAMTAESVGTVTFRSALGNIDCALELEGVLLARAEGTLGSLRPEANPFIGSATVGGAEECTPRGAVLRLTFPIASWAFYNTAIEGVEARLYLLEAHVLVSFRVFTIDVRCLYRMLVDFIYNEGTGIATITGSRLLRQEALLFGRCAENPGLAGRLAIEVEERGRPRFALEP